jgi:hypothetical protein
MISMRLPSEQRTFQLALTYQWPDACRISPSNAIACSLRTVTYRSIAAIRLHSSWCRQGASQHGHRLR